MTPDMHGQTTIFKIELINGAVPPTSQEQGLERKDKRLRGPKRETNHDADYTRSLV